MQLIQDKLEDQTKYFKSVKGNKEPAASQPDINEIES